MSTAQDIAAAVTAALNALNLNIRDHPKFDPSKDVNSWLLTFNASTAGYTDDQKIAALPLTLQGPALTWYSSKVSTPGGIQHTWANWEVELRKEFGRSPMAVFNELLNRCQQPGEDPITYYRSVLDLCAMANASMSEVEKMNHLVRGLLPNLREKIVLMCPTTSADFLNKLQILQSTPAPLPSSSSTNDAKIIEALTLALAAAQRPSLPSIASPAAQSPTVQPQLFQQPQPSSSNDFSELTTLIRNLDNEVRRLSTSRQRSAQSAVTCYSCGVVGHYSSNCRNRGRRTVRQSNYNRPRQQNRGYSPGHYHRGPSPSRSPSPHRPTQENDDQRM